MLPSLLLAAVVWAEGRRRRSRESRAYETREELCLAAFGLAVVVVAMVLTKAAAKGRSARLCVWCGCGMWCGWFECERQRFFFFFGCVGLPPWWRGQRRQRPWRHEEHHAPAIPTPAKDFGFRCPVPPSPCFFTFFVASLCLSEDDEGVCRLSFLSLFFNAFILDLLALFFLPGPPPGRHKTSHNKVFYMPALPPFLFNCPCLFCSFFVIAGSKPRDALPGRQPHSLSGPSRRQDSGNKTTMLSSKPKPSAPLSAPSHRANPHSMCFYSRQARHGDGNSAIEPGRRRTGIFVLRGRISFCVSRWLDPPPPLTSATSVARPHRSLGARGRQGWQRTRTKSR